MKAYRDYQPQQRVKKFAKRHGLRSSMQYPPHEGRFLRVWFDMDDQSQAAAEKKARKLYGTRGGYTK